MSEIININHETGDLTQYSQTWTQSGELSVNSQAALVNTNYGLSVYVDDANIRIAKINLGSANTSGKVRIRFYIDPNTVVMGNNTTEEVLSAFSDAPDRVLSVGLKYLTASGYSIVASAIDDLVAYITLTAVDITDNPHWVEVYMTRATTNLSGDGFIQVWVDGVAGSSNSTIDNYDRFDNFWSINFGLTAPVGSASGTYYLDELIANDDGGQIGGMVAIKITPERTYAEGVRIYT